MRQLIRVCLLGVALVGAAPALVDARTWTDRTGRQLEADFVGFADGQVQIKRTSDGIVFKWPLERFSDADQAFVRSQGNAKPPGPEPDARPSAITSKKPESKEPKLVPPDETIKLPQELRDAASQTFKQGLRYFVWVPEKGPFKREPQGTVLIVPLNYICEGEPLPFDTSFTIIRKEGKDVLEESIQTEGPKSFSSKGKAGVLHLDFFRKYSGKGAAKVFLIDRKTKKPISNEPVVEIELQ